MAANTLAALLLVSCSKVVLATDAYDYIIIGAGTSGLVVANRLSEDPSVTVAVVEAGTDQRNNPNVTDPNQFMAAFGTSIDWNYTTVKQPGAGGRALEFHQGKAWGGTSAINGMTYIRGDAPLFDSWEELGNPGWNWASLLPYYKKSEKYTIPNPEQLAAGATYESEYHGFAGHLDTGYVNTLTNGSAAQPVLQTWASFGLPHNPDINRGVVRGYGMGPQTINPALGLRWDSARAYYHPVEGRTNLKILQGTVKRITWTADKGRRRRCDAELVVASGVEYLTADGKTEVLKAKKEVVVSAGAARTPLVLESSGIGNPRLLETLGIATKVDLPGVGENLIEQPNHVVAFSGSGLDSSPSAYHTFLTISDLFGGDKAAALETATWASIPAWAEAAVTASGKLGLEKSTVEKLLRAQHGLLFQKNVTAAEIITVVAPNGLFASNFWILFPFSRGSVHLGDAAKINEPLFDPRFFLADFDYNATVAIGKQVQKFWLTQPMRAFTSAPLIPGPDLLPNDASNEQWKDFLQNNLATNSHPLSTAAMMSRELGGVVDPELRVYGTANVRVVDASVLPTQLSGHLTATLYAVAERASDIIKKTAFGGKA